MKIINKFISAFFNPAIDLRVRLFHVLAMGGTIISFLVTILAVINNAGIINIMINLMSTILSYTLLTYSRRSGHYQVCYFITIVAIFIVFFPVCFFTAGGYHSGMPTFFVFAVVFTIFMIEGKKAIALSIMELLIYIAICLVAYLYPDTVQAFSKESEILIDIIVAFIAVSAILGICMFLHFRLYNEQQRKLNEQNEILDQANRAKSEFLSNTSHEMRTPLTVISVNVQTVTDILDELAVKDEEAGELLKNAQYEIMRLARMVGGMLMLASMSENTDRRKMDLSSLLLNCVEMLRLNLAKHGNVIDTDIEKNLQVFGNADLLAQVLSNLLQNAGAHMENGTATVRANMEDGVITVSVRDTGTGISPELLPHVFKRGVSSGGTGLGLHLCKTVIDYHGGKIWIESEPGNGTAVFYTLPVYEGQFGGEKK